MKHKKLNKGSAGQNRKAGEAFLSKYRSKPQVQDTGSGLLYQILDTGSGLPPALTDTVVTHQRVLNTEGVVIEDSYQTGMADRFKVKDAIPGLQEGLQLMEEGARYEFAIPSELAWGKRGVGNKIGPNAVLVIDVRLLEVLPA